jgi:hypothetical protein
MRLLIVSDSHGRGLEAIIQRDYKDWNVMTVWVGAQLEYVRSKYYDQMQEVYEFNPTYVILHVGHNDIMYHPHHNDSPQHIKYYFPEVIEFLQLLQGYHPLTKVFYSTIFPRCEGYDMTAVEKRNYNVLAGRFGVQAKSTCIGRVLDLFRIHAYGNPYISVHCVHLDYYSLLCLDWFLSQRKERFHVDI